MQTNFLYAGSVKLSKEELFSSAAHKICVSAPYLVLCSLPETVCWIFQAGGEIADTVELTVNADPVYPDPEVEGYLVRIKY